MYTIDTIKTKTVHGYTAKIELVDFCEGSPWFSDLYTAQEHEGGVTVQVPGYLYRGGDKHYRGQTTPAELAKHYAASGCPNPSAKAYADLQKELAHYIQASDCAFRVTVSRNGYELGEAYSCGFELSCEYDYDIENLWKELQDSCVKEAFDIARETLGKQENAA